MTAAEQFAQFGAWCRGTSPLYERLAHGIADDPTALDLAAVVPDGRSTPHVFLGAVHALLLAGREHALADYYPSLTSRPIDADPYPAFRDFCSEFADDLHPLLRTRRTQTNAVERCSALLPAFEHVSRAISRRPLALVELGASAGLNLCWDRYAYEYVDIGRYGPADSPVTITADVRGEPPSLPDAGLPPVASRVGVDLHPLSVSDAADVNWLSALIWPEHDARRDRLQNAIDLVRRDPPDVLEGDALTLLPTILADVPAERSVCIYNTHLLYQLPTTRRRELVDRLTALTADLELHWVSGEAMTDRPHPPTLRHVASTKGDTRVTELLRYEMHGRWIERTGEVID